MNVHGQEHIVKPKDYQEFTVIITAAGVSRRMGTDKAALLRPDGKTFTSYLVELYLPMGADPLVLVVNETSSVSNTCNGNLSIVINHSPEKGRGHSIELGVKQLPAGLPCFIQSIDNQHVNEDLLRKMLSVIDADSYCVPVFRGKGGHPVLLGAKVLDYIRSNGVAPDLKDLLLRFKRIEIPCHSDDILLNINTPEDYNSFLSGK